MQFTTVSALLLAAMGAVATPVEIEARQAGVLSYDLYLGGGCNQGNPVAPRATITAVDRSCHPLPTQSTTSGSLRFRQPWTAGTIVVYRDANCTGNFNVVNRPNAGDNNEWIREPCISGNFKSYQFV
ncbi:hypothetical protein B0J11DRAFT_503684 [Dendryphion nanum]|uniref:Uncharacterized protein n=1 Tax=Dendryphion nanum TaxID=256645 RepID=A0A9P9IVQ2_9PLEO|nr:hypothetical protein B0J11DRAFT_503684 [Dendryphion nanum]